MKTASSVQPFMKMKVKQWISTNIKALLRLETIMSLTNGLFANIQKEKTEYRSKLYLNRTRAHEQQCQLTTPRSVPTGKRH